MRHTQDKFLITQRELVDVISAAKSVQGSNPHRAWKAIYDAGFEQGLAMAALRSSRANSMLDAANATTNMRRYITTACHALGIAAPDWNKLDE